MARHQINFTKAALDRLELPEAGKRSEVYDTHMPGLHLRITSNGAKSFAVLRWNKERGKPERITIGRYPACTIEAARKVAGGINVAIASGASPAAAIRERKAELTLGELFTLYIERHAEPRGRKSVNAMRETWERYIGELPPGGGKSGRRKKHPKGANWEHRKLSSVKAADVMRLHADLGGAGVRTSANRVRQLLSAMFNKAMEWSVYPGPNPAAKIEPFRELKRDRFIQSDELPRFFAALAEEPSKDVRDFVLLSLLTGARRGNVLAMRWDHVSVSRGEWKIPETKNGDAHAVPLTAEALEVLKSRSATDDVPASGFVFASADAAAGYLTTPRRGWLRVLKRAGLSNLRIHDLRRSLGSWQAKTGASLAIIGKSLGHKTASATMIYARLDQDPVRESIERATSAMFDAGKVKEQADVVPINSTRKTA